MWLLKLVVYCGALVGLYVWVVWYITRSRDLQPPEPGWELVEYSDSPDEVEVD